MHRSYEVTFRRGEKVWHVFQARARGGHTQNGLRFNASWWKTTACVAIALAPCAAPGAQAAKIP